MPSSTQAYKDLQDAITQSNQYAPVSSQDIMKELSNRVGNFSDQNRAIADTTAKIFASPFNDLSNLSDQYGTGGNSTLSPLAKLKVLGNNLGNLYGQQDFQQGVLKQQQGGLNDILQSIMSLYQTQGQGAQQRVSNAQNLYTLSKQAEDSAASRAGQSTNINDILAMIANAKAASDAKNAQIEAQNKALQASQPTTYTLPYQGSNLNVPQIISQIYNPSNGGLNSGMGGFTRPSQGISFIK